MAARSLAEGPGGTGGAIQDTTTRMRSIIRWAGSKRQLLPDITPLVPANYERYIEPFAGSASLFFTLAPRLAILGDINAELMLTYRQLRRNPAAVHRAVTALPRTKETYYQLRATQPSDLPAFDRAVRFLFLNRNCFNGVYRVNTRGHFNVPWGTKTGEFPSLTEFRASATALRRAILTTSDFETVIDEARKDDFVYLDPPYSSSMTGEPGLFGAGAFTPADLARLMAALKRLDKRGATFVLSFEYDRSLAHHLNNPTVRTVKATRHVAGFSQARGRVKELLLTNANR